MQENMQMRGRKNTDKRLLKKRITKIKLLGRFEGVSEWSHPTSIEGTNDVYMRELCIKG